MKKIMKGELMAVLMSLVMVVSLMPMTSRSYQRLMHLNLRLLS